MPEKDPKDATPAEKAARTRETKAAAKEAVEIISGEAEYVTWPAWPPYPEQGVEWGPNVDSSLMPLIAAALVVNGAWDLLWYNGGVGPYFGQGHDEALTEVKRMIGAGAVTGISADVWDFLGRVPREPVPYPGDDSFEPGTATSGSLIIQCLLLLNNCSDNMGSLVFRMWRSEAQLDLEKFQKSVMRRKNPDGVPDEATWNRLFAVK